MESPYRFILCSWLVITSFVMVIIVSAHVSFGSGYKHAQSDLRFESRCNDLTR